MRALGMPAKSARSRKNLQVACRRTALFRRAASANGADTVAQSTRRRECQRGGVPKQPSDSIGNLPRPRRKWLQTVSVTTPKSLGLTTIDAVNARVLTLIQHYLNSVAGQALTLTLVPRSRLKRSHLAFKRGMFPPWRSMNKPLPSCRSVPGERDRAVAVEAAAACARPMRRAAAVFLKAGAGGRHR